MLFYAVLFFGCALISTIVGSSFLVGTAASVAQGLFVLFLALFAVAIRIEKEPVD
jgi:uncharacterized membrane protein YtjA (UPF0391 family)